MIKFEFKVSVLFLLMESCREGITRDIVLESKNPRNQISIE